LGLTRIGRWSSPLRYQAGLVRPGAFLVEMKPEAVNWSALRPRPAVVVAWGFAPGDPVLTALAPYYVSRDGQLYLRRDLDAPVPRPSARTGG
jgi:hypothetical protein